MDYSQTFLSGGRYELLGTQGSIEVLDHEPWRRCWSCGSTSNESGESFCMNCGAALEKRVYHGVLVDSAQPDGLALITSLDDAFVRAVLPNVWDVVVEDDRTLVLVDNNGYSSAMLPIDEIDALQVGLDLARALMVLHGEGLVLGKLITDDVGMTAAGQTHLFDAPDLRRIRSDATSEDVNNDLQDLAGLLEELTVTPRTTQRLQEDDIALQHEQEVVQDNALSLTSILRQIRTGMVEDAAHLADLLDALLVDMTYPIPLQQETAAGSDTGMVRDHNEDSLLALRLKMNNISTDRLWGLYVVADGMGGHAAGEIASGLAVRGVADVIMREYLTKALDPEVIYNQKWVNEIVRQAVLYANESVRNEGRVFGNDMGTTLTMALVIGDRATIANVGDSRTFLFREGKLRRISRDHSLVMRLVELGQIAEDDIYTHPQRNAVLRSLGDQGEIEVDLFQERLQSGDVLLLCSDGQWEMTRTPEMERILATYDDPRRACDELIKAANRAGGEDNVTSIIVRLM